MSRRAAAILLAIAFIVALPSTASSATPSGKPAAETAAQKKKPKKPKKHKKKKGKKNKTPIKLWYRIAVEGRGEKSDRVVTNSTLRQTTNYWSAPSRSAVIVSRELAPIPIPSRSFAYQYRFRAGFDGELTDSTYTETFVSPTICPAHTNTTTQITPGLVEGAVSGLIGPSAWVQVTARGLAGRALFRTDYTGACFLQEQAPEVTVAPSLVTCPDEERWTASGKVAWGGAFTVIATCLSHWAGNYGASTDYNSSVTLRFTPCPGRGTRVKAC